MAKLIQSVLLLALLGAVQADDAVHAVNDQQLHDLWAAAAAATPSNEVTVTYTGSVIKATTAQPPVLTTGPSLAAAPPFSIPGRPGFVPPWLRGITSLPAGWGQGTLTAGAVCGPYTLPVNLPFSPPCPYSSTATVAPTSERPPPPPPPPTTTSIIKTLPPTTLPTVAVPPASSSKSTVVVTATVTLKPDPPYTPDAARTTLVTVRRQ
ncbi:hypothetical protein SBRCBS47491_007320 [Sporothrix bragantina]|uniref:Uncharacterized protein n=1 Tax=Sporothrix bragantina TaxID=671064 RepID=A0ABP0CCL5_9PEZI